MFAGSDADWLKPLLAVLFGWGLNSVSQLLLGLSERREAVSKALSDLLEIRHQLLALDLAMVEIGKIVPLAPHLEAHFRLVLEQMIIPDPNQLYKRYDESVSLIAAVDPILAFRLRSKDLMRPLMKNIDALMAQDINAAPFGQKLTKMLLPHMEQQLNRALKSLAWRRGPITRWRVGRALQTLRFPADGVDFVAVVRQEMEKHQAAVQAASQPGSH
jgi:hypothetical protein